MIVYDPDIDEKF